MPDKQSFKRRLVWLKKKRKFWLHNFRETGTNEQRSDESERDAVKQVTNQRGAEKVMFRKPSWVGIRIMLPSVAIMRKHRNYAAISRPIHHLLLNLFSDFVFGFHGKHKSKQTVLQSGQKVAEDSNFEENDWEHPEAINSWLVAARYSTIFVIRIRRLQQVLENNWRFLEPEKRLSKKHLGN